MVHPRARVGFLAPVFAVALFSGVSAATAQPAAPPAADKESSPAASPATAVATSSTPLPSDEEMEHFLKNAKIKSVKGTKKGVTGSSQATMVLGSLTHDAHIQTIDEYKREFRSTHGVEIDFRDSWTYNVAAYKLDRMLGLNLVPVSVAGRHRSDRAAITWWVDDYLMDEGDRLKKKIEPPNKELWNKQMKLMRLFDELIANTDRNLGNMLYTRDWRLWAIDHTRAFRKLTTLKHPSYVSACDGEVFERLKALDRPTLKRELGEYLDDGHIKGILARRDLIVKKLESLGPSALFTR